jgi:hypothetical protein
MGGQFAEVTDRSWSPRAVFRPTSGAPARSEKSFFDGKFSGVNRLVCATVCNALSLIAPIPALWLDLSRVHHALLDVAF